MDKENAIKFRKLTGWSTYKKKGLDIGINEVFSAEYA